MPTPLVFPGGFETRLEFETLISDLSAKLVTASDETFSAAVEAALAEVVTFFGADRGGLIEVQPDRRNVRLIHAWYSQDLIDRIPETFNYAEHMPWACYTVIERRQPLVVASLAHLPPEAAQDRDVWKAWGTCSTLAVPLVMGESVPYAIALDAMHREVQWPATYLPRLQLLGQIFVSSLTRRRAAEAFRESEVRFGLVTEAAGAIPWDMDLSSGRIWATPEGKETHGWPRDIDLTLDVLFATVHPDDVAHVQDAIKAIVASQSERIVEYRALMPGGGFKWIEARGRFRGAGPDGGQPHIMGVSVDVTARKQEEGERRVATARLASAVDVASLGFYEVGDGSQLSYLDGRCRELFGVPSDLTDGTRPVEFWVLHVHPDDRPRLLELQEQLNDGRLERVAISYRYLHPTRGATWLYQVTHVTTRYPSGLAQKTIGVVRDVTEDTLREEALRASEEVNRATFEQAAVGIAHVGTDGTWLRVNDKLCAILGYTREELVGMTFQAVTQPDHVAASLDLVHRTLAGRSDGFSLEKRYIRKDGGVIWANLTVSLVLDAGGHPRHFIAVIEDITARKDAEETLAKAHAEVQRLRDQLERENVYLRQETRALKGPHQIVGRSDAIRRALADVEKVAPTLSTVLLLGETGTGKELFAEAIHEGSPRRDRTMVRVNCAAIPVTLIESELFGRERGAYTGALSKQVGRFELANGSTIFLDEIGDLPMDIQVKLLRVLQERQIERLGNPRPVPVDLRIIAATHRDLEGQVLAGRFRQDLYYRLSVFPVRVPPLRERRDDIPLLVEALTEELAGRMGKRVESVTRANMEALLAYDWPGNVRELRNVVERALILATGPVLEIPVPAMSRRAAAPPPPDHDVLDRAQLLEVLEQAHWRVRGKDGAAERLGLKPTTLESRMARLGVRRP